MADRYTGAFIQLEKAMDTSISFASTHPRLSELTASMKGQRMSVNDALRLLQIYIGQYQRQDRKEAVRYCTLEMQRILYCHEHASLHSMYPKIDFRDPVQPGMQEIMDRKRPLFENLYFKSIRRWTIWSSLILAGLCALFVLVLHFPFFWVFWILLFGWFQLQWIGIHQEVPLTINRKMQNMEDSLDEEQRALIRGWNVQIPSVPEQIRYQVHKRTRKFLKGKKS